MVVRPNNASLQVQPHDVYVKQLEATAVTLEGSREKLRPRNIIAVGLRGVYSESMSEAILELTEALHAPVLTILHAKGVVDESHPFSSGVIGVHGKPGLEAAAMLVSSSDCILSIGMEDESLLVCNMVGLQVCGDACARLRQWHPLTLSKHRFAN
jgi:thiamine pyrophosphate-dependent acetolactate synthase large subunit-like protein